ncbi:hypothetical protein EIP86_002067 [Pleurotus ostreatoroseus]|nr:hypothetical protein EIP86_002067 [Pleurotus ostreatoroseus]
MEKLEIETIWWMWRGHLQDYYEGYDTQEIYDGQEARDSMDRWNYDEKSSFPMRKPNFDVFGVPRRTRSQRGWYYIRQHPSAQRRGPQSISVPELLFSPPKPAAMVRTSWADLPIELVELIGKTLAHMPRRELGLETMKACALVCRRWARRFLFTIVRIATIRSRRQALELQELECLPGSLLRQLDTPGHVMWLNPAGVLQLPWLHLVTQVPRRRVENNGHYDRFRLKLAGPLPASLKTIRSIHQALPRSVPRSFSRCITRLELNDIHFQRFSDLFHLVCELPDLWFLQCQKVTWGSPVTTSSLRQRHLGSRRERHFEARFDPDESSARAQAYIFLLVQHMTFTERSFAHCSHLPVLSPPERVLNNVHIARLLLIGPRSDLLRIPGEQESEVKDRTPLCWFELHGVFSTSIQTALRVLPDGALVPSYVMHVTVDLWWYHKGSVCCDTSNTPNSAYWAAFHNYLMLLNPRYVVFGFPSREYMTRFTADVVDTVMPDLAARAAVLYAIRDSNGWYKVSRDVAALECEQDGKFELSDLIYGHDHDYRMYVSGVFAWVSRRTLPR